MLFYSKSMENIYPWVVVRGMIGTIYNGDYQTLLHTKYRGSMMVHIEFDQDWPTNFRNILL